MPYETERMLEARSEQDLSTICNWLDENSDSITQALIDRYFGVAMEFNAATDDIYPPPKIMSVLPLCNFTETISEQRIALPSGWGFISNSQIKWYMFNDWTYPLDTKNKHCFYYHPESDSVCDLTAGQVFIPTDVSYESALRRLRFTEPRLIYPVNPDYGIYALIGKREAIKYSLGLVYQF